MTRFSASIAALLTLGILSGCADSQNTERQYFGQTPPGSTPQVFAPGIVNTAENRDVEGMFGTDMNTFYFIRRPLGDPSSSNVLVAIEYKNERWQETVLKQGESEPSISPDGTTIYFANQYMKRTSEGWSELKTLSGPLEDIAIMRGSVASSGAYYFDTYTDQLDTPLRYSRLIDGEYEQPKSLGTQFGIGTYNAHPFIAPDESYVIWDSRRDDGYGSSDLYISYKATDGIWGTAINLGDQINTDAAENYPSVSPDGNFLTFDRRDDEDKNGDRPVDIYWVDAEFIETLKPRP